MEGNQDRHDFAQTEAAATMALKETIAEQLLLPERFKLLAEIIHRAKEVF
jgi:hypothetical protein